MLGKRPCLLRTTSSRSLLIPCEDMEGEPTTLCNYAQVVEKSARLASSAPCKVVIGFDIGTEKKPSSDACESPRSVLDSLALLPSQEKQHVVARSPRSGLGSLLTAQSGSGVGPVMVTQINDEEVNVHVGSVAGSFKAAFLSQNCLHETCSDKMSLSFKSSHYDSKDIPSWQRQAHYVLCVKDERLDADISPLRSQAMFLPSSQDMNAKFTDIYISPHQIRALDACIENGFKEGCLNAVSSWQSGVASCGPGSEGAGDGCKNDHIFTLQSEAWSLCEDACTDVHIAPRQRQALHQVSLDIECEEISIQQSIFSATSPPSCAHSLTTSFSGFLEVCSYCGHSLRLGKDIFMYRGDQAFCSADCRYQKILLDESKEKQGR